MITKIQHSACSILLFVFISANLLHSGLHLHLFFEHGSKHSDVSSHPPTFTNSIDVKIHAQDKHEHNIQSVSFVARVPNIFSAASLVTLQHFILTTSFITDDRLPNFFIVVNPPPLLSYLLDSKSCIHSGIAPPIA